MFKRIIVLAVPQLYAWTHQVPPQLPKSPELAPVGLLPVPVLAPTLYLHPNPALVAYSLQIEGVKQSDGKVNFTCQAGNFRLELQVIDGTEGPFLQVVSYSRLDTSVSNLFRSHFCLRFQECFYRLGIFYGFFYGSSFGFLSATGIGQAFMNDVDKALSHLIVDGSLSPGEKSAIIEQTKNLVKAGYDHGYSLRPGLGTGPLCPFQCLQPYSIRFHKECPFKFTRTGEARWQESALWQPGVEDPRGPAGTQVPGTPRLQVRRG